MEEKEVERKIKILFDELNKTNSAVNKLIKKSKGIENALKALVDGLERVFGIE